jgi:hypothetical protein
MASRRKIGWISAAAIGVLAVLLILPAGGLAYDLQGNYQNPVTANPPVHSPPTASCTVTLLNTWPFDNELGKGTAYGLYAPPPACPAPWRMVVLNWSTSVQGVQYDRLGTLDIGGIEIFRTVNAEPDLAGITWNVYKDVTEYSPTLASPHVFVATMNNYVFGPYTGVIYVNATLTFYEASAAYPAPSIAATILQAANQTIGPGVNSSMTLSSLPENISRAYLEVYATGHSCDEFWYTNVPNSFMSNPYAAPNGLCGGTALRELDVYVDGHFAGVATPFPYIYTGGINPYLWEPIPAVDTFNIQPYMFDLSPFAALLSNGAPHTINVSVLNNANYWVVNANLFLYEQSIRTTGGLILDHSTFRETVAYTVVSLPGNPDFAIAANFTTFGTRSLLVEGFIHTPHGVARMTVQESYTFANQQNYLLSYIDSQENVTQLQMSWSMSELRAPRDSSTVVTTELYPLYVAAGFYQVAQGYLIPATVFQGKITSVMTTGEGARRGSFAFASDMIQANASWIYGSSILPTARTTQTYFAIGSGIPAYFRSITAVNGLVV